LTTGKEGNASHPGSLIEHIAQIAHKYPSKPAIIHASAKFETKDFASLFNDTQMAARLLRKKGLLRGDRTLLMVKPGYDLIITCLAIIYIGAIPIIVDPGMGIKKAIQCIHHSKPTALVSIPLVGFISVFLRRTFSSVRKKIIINKNSYEKFRKTKKSEGEFDAFFPKPSDLAAIIFTSGSTGPAKGVRYLHSNFRAQVLALKNEFGLSPGEVDLTTLPVFSLFNPALGITSVIPNMNPKSPVKSDGSTLVKNITDHQVTTAFCSPLIGQKIASHCESNKIKLLHLKRLMLAGAPTHPTLVRRLSKVAPNARIYLPYGATEALPVAFCDHSEVDANFDSILSGDGSCLGKPVNGVDIMLIQPRNSPIPHDFEERIKPIKNSMAVGEICVTGKVVTDGYDRMPGATRDSRFIFDGKAFHRMGDLGYMDKMGLLRFLGRKVECVNTPAGILETERCEPIANSVDGVYRSALIGLGKANPKEPCIIVELDHKVNKTFDEIKEELLLLFNERLTKYKISKIFREYSLPVDARHNTKIHRLSLAKKWTGLLSTKKNSLGS